MRIRWIVALGVVAAGVALTADEGMWRFDQLPLETIGATYGVALSRADLQRVEHAAVRLLSGNSGGTGTFASSDGLILTNHHVALDCIRTSTLAERGRGDAENLIAQGFTAASRREELPCRRFRAQIERGTTDVTDRIDAAVEPGMDIARIQQARQRARSDIERACQQEHGTGFSCQVVDFNSGARSVLVVWQEYQDIRLVYAPELQLGFYGGDEMNFRFPRYVSDISILRAYEGTDGSRGEYDETHVPATPESHLSVSLDGIHEGDFTFVAGFPANTNRYRMSLSAEYNIRKGIPDQIRDLEQELTLLRRHAAADPTNQVILQSRIFGLANTLKYQQDVLAALRATDIVGDRRRRERELLDFLATRPDLQAEYGDVVAAQTAVYEQDVEANAGLDNALQWLQRSTVLSDASALYQFALARAEPSDQEREPQFQERNWPQVREALLDDEPVIVALEEDLLTVAFEKAVALPDAQRIPAVRDLAARVRAGAGAAPSPRDLARAVLAGTRVPSVDARQALIDAAVSRFDESQDSAVAFARALEPSLRDLRARVRILNEKIFRNRSRFARAMQAWKGSSIYPDANFTLRATYGRVAGVTKNGERIPFATRFRGLFDLAARRGNTGDFALPASLVDWRKRIGDAAFAARYADMPVDFISNNDITGGNSGSALLNRNLDIVGLIFDGNEGSMASDWSYNGVTGRSISTDIRFALTVAREVHRAGWIVDELLGGG